MARPRLRYLQREVDRHGNVRWRLRKGRGRRIRIYADYNTPEFFQEYTAALLNSTASTKVTPKTNTLRWAIDKYRQSSAWAALSPATRKQRENIFKKVIEKSGDVPLAKVTTKAIREARERRKETPHAANVFIKAMRKFFAWCVEEGLVKSDPTLGVKLLSGVDEADGFPTWSPEELDRFEKRWPVGTRERLAYDLLFYTGLRRGDAVSVGRQHVQDGVITIKTEKHRQGKEAIEVSIPILPPLAKSIEAAPTGDLVFLINERGQPWVKESFGNWFRDVCRAADCPGSAHGLRKAGATRAAENGATERQLMAIFGWTTGKQAAHYTRKADRKRLAQSAAHLLLPPAQSKNRNTRTMRPVRAKIAKDQNNQELKK